MSHYFRPAYEMPNIYPYRDPVDFRKSFCGLAAIVEQELGHNPFDGGLYAFTNRRRNKIKCLYPVLATMESGSSTIALKSNGSGGQVQERKLPSRYRYAN